MRRLFLAGLLCWPATAGAQGAKHQVLMSDMQNDVEQALQVGEEVQCGILPAAAAKLAITSIGIQDMWYVSNLFGGTPQEQPEINWVAKTLWNAEQLGEQHLYVPCSSLVQQNESNSNSNLNSDNPDNSGDDSGN